MVAYGLNTSDLEGLARLRFDPFAVDVALSLLEE